MKNLGQVAEFSQPLPALAKDAGNEGAAGHVSRGKKKMEKDEFEDYSM